MTTSDAEASQPETPQPRTAGQMARGCGKGCLIAIGLFFVLAVVVGFISSIFKANSHDPCSGITNDKAYSDCVDNHPQP